MEPKTHDEKINDLLKEENKTLIATQLLTGLIIAVLTLGIIIVLI
jgi:hypothetical protein